MDFEKWYEEELIKNAELYEEGESERISKNMWRAIAIFEFVLIIIVSVIT
jgi:hypothetical protein